MNCPSDNAKNSTDKYSSFGISELDLKDIPDFTIEPEIKNQTEKHIVCPKCVGLYATNTKTGEMINLRCKSYHCPYCGNIQKKHLKKALNKYISSWETAKMFTFTIRSTAYGKMNLISVYANTSEIWRRFIINLKRSTNLTNGMKNWKYVKVVEFHQSGYVHYHVALDRFMNILELRRLWIDAINQALKSSGDNGNISISKEVNHKRFCVWYLVKYVTKDTHISKKMKHRKWSKNGKGSIFDKIPKSPDWILVNNRHLNLFPLSITSQAETDELERLCPKIEFSDDIMSIVATDEIFNEYFI